jgi:hypothetical protein
MSVAPADSPPKYEYGQPTSFSVQQLQAAPSTGLYPNHPQQPGGPWGYQAPYPGPYYPYPQPPPPPPPQQQQQQQQQQQVVIINQTETVTTVELVESFNGQVITACIVIWFCNCLFGLVGFILAMVAGDKAGSDPTTANQLGKASYGVSISGAIVSIIIVAIIVGVSSSSPSGGSSSGSSCSYSYLGSCYSNRICSITYSDCTYFYGVYNNSSGCCYYNSY